MRVLPASICWSFAGGRIINLHHGLLPAFPGAHPYRDAFSHRMLTYGATVHFIVPELDAGAQIIHQDTFTVPPGTPLDETLRFTSPAYLMELYVTARHFDQSPDLYGPIEMRNPAVSEVTSGFHSAAREVADILVSGDRERIRALFEEVRDFFGPFTHEALEQSSFLIDRLVERL